MNGGRIDVGRGLVRLQLLVQCLTLCVLIGFPLVATVWDFASLIEPSLPSNWPLLGHFMSQMDGGAQPVVARTILRAFIAGFCVTGLLLPLAEVPSMEGWRAKPWGFLFLLTGLVAVAGSPRTFLAFREWLTWALLLSVAFVLRRTRQEALGKLSLALMYLVAFSVYIHSLWVVIPLSLTRPGGIFYHSNILSTFCLISLPILAWRAKERTWEGGVAGFLAGALLALQFWTGSLTGACVLSLALAYLAWPAESVRGRYIVSLMALGLPAAFNLLGEDLSAWCGLALFLGLLCAVFARWRHRMPSRSLLAFGVSLILSLFCFSLLAPNERHRGMVQNRGNSAAARVEFYRAGLNMWAERPLVGQGPAAFAREYPRFQSSVRYYSKFVHSLPLELASEWGTLGFLFLSLCLASRWGDAKTDKDIAIRWATGLFLLHSLSGVQTQFPYLLLLVALAWGFEGETLTRSPGSREKVYQGLGRILAAIAFLMAISWNSWIMSANFDRSLALEIYKERGPRSISLVSELFDSSASVVPQDGLTWLQWSMISLDRGGGSEASWRASNAIGTDSQWAAARKLKMVATPQGITEQEVDEAIAIDPINYPAFYRMKARLRHEAGDTEGALDLLLQEGEKYDPQVLSTLAEFRTEDLEEQLVEFWLLAAVLSEHLGDYKNAESNFRQALSLAQKRASRIRKLLSYSQRTNLRLGPLVTDLLLQVAEQVPAQDLPSSVQGPPD